MAAVALVVGIVSVVGVRFVLATGSAHRDYLMGRRYLVADGVPKDTQRAIKLLTRAAQGHDPDACFALGELYSQGHDVPNDMSKALVWYSLADEYGHPVAFERVAFYYRNGWGTGMNIPKAAEVTIRAAQRGQSTAWVTTAYLYSGGVGVNKDMIAAYAWANIALANSADAHNRELRSKMLEDLAARMSPEQVAEAQQLSQKLISEFPKR